MPNSSAACGKGPFIGSTCPGIFSRYGAGSRWPESVSWCAVINGLGDTIQFIRFLQPLREVAHSVGVWVQPALLDLSKTARGIDAAFPLHDGITDVEHDADVEIMELPHALRIASIPATILYLFPPQATKSGKPRSTFSVGLIWQAGSWDPRRSIPDRAIRPLGGLTGVRLYSLQHPKSREPIPFPDVSRAHICACAAEMLALDLVVTVDTVAAHLAGALGCRTWTLLHQECDWRWPLDGPVTAWYPTMRLFHQQRSGDWDSVIEELYSALQEEGEKWHSSREPSMLASNISA
jgi:hypothetical protein